MTAPDPRLDEIQARLSADWEASMSGGYIGDDQCMKDRDFLLAELRKAHEAVADAKAEALEEAAAIFAGRLPDGTGNGRAYNSYLVANMLHARAASLRGES